MFFTITAEGDHLYEQLTGQAKFELFAEDDSHFFLKVVDAQLTFYMGSQGKASEVVLHQNGRDQTAKRSEAGPPAAKEHKAITVDPKLLDRYVGAYHLAPNFVLTVTREKDQLLTQATGQPKFEIFPESETEFFLKVVDAQITFEIDSKGQVTGVILHQSGRDLPASRIR